MNGISLDLNSVLFYGGIVISALSLILIVILSVRFHFKQKMVAKELQKEYEEK